MIRGIFGSITKGTLLVSCVRGGGDPRVHCYEDDRALGRTRRRWPPPPGVLTQLLLYYYYYESLYPKKIVTISTRILI